MDLGFVLKCIVLFSGYCAAYIFGRIAIERLSKQPHSNKFIRDYGAGVWLVFVSILVLIISDTIF
jgi:hypothetical protein|tara:strand:- start:253 stop:447 length:195 start_codon:yes stop_codon:yes gene_type:complete